MSGGASSESSTIASWRRRASATPYPVTFS